jgi:hypothetical protein
VSFPCGLRSYIPGGLARIISGLCLLVLIDGNH